MPIALKNQRDPGDVELTRRGRGAPTRVRVVIVVPAFAERQERHPPAVARVVARLEAAEPYYVRGRVDQPRAVQNRDDAGEIPRDHRPAADREEDGGRAWSAAPAIRVQPAVELVAAGSRWPSARCCCDGCRRTDPAMCAQNLGVARRMRIAVDVGVLAMLAAGRDRRSALERQRPRSPGANAFEHLNPRCVCSRWYETDAEPAAIQCSRGHDRVPATRRTRTRRGEV